MLDFLFGKKSVQSRKSSKMAKKSKRSTKMVKKSKRSTKTRRNKVKRGGIVIF
jgi:hypothetical protein